MHFLWNSPLAPSTFYILKCCWWLIMYIKKNIDNILKNETWTHEVKTATFLPMKNDEFNIMHSLFVHWMCLGSKPWTLECSLVSAGPEKKSVLISNKSRWGPFPGQSATTTMFLTHCRALRHSLILTTTRDVTLGATAGYDACGAEVKNCKTLHQNFFFFPKMSLSENKKRMRSLWFPLHSSSLCSFSFLFILPHEPSSYIITLPAGIQSW